MSEEAPPPESQDDGLPRPGDVLDGKFRVDKVLGGGGMGVVVAATHLKLEEQVAIKFLNPNMVTQETVARFSREARAAAKIKSSFVARVSDVGTLSTGSPYMVMEYLEGRDLKQIVRERGPFDVREAADYVLQAVEAVAEAHSLGIIHRDIKPSNLFLASRGGGDAVVKVLDFGISKLTPRSQSLPPDDPGMTRTSTWLGSPLYMSPEQLRSAKDVDFRADIWALGVTLFELVTGKVPFNSDNFPDLCTKILHEDAPRITDVRPGLPPGLAAIVERCLEKDPTVRYPSCADLAVDLVRFAPKRSRSIAERAVSLCEQAGLVPERTSPRRRLDASLPEPIMSPMAALEGDGNRSTPPPPLRRKSIPPRSAARGPSSIPPGKTPRPIRKPDDSSPGLDGPSDPLPLSKATRSSQPPGSTGPESTAPNSTVPNSTTGGVSLGGAPLRSVPPRPSQRPSYLPDDFEDPKPDNLHKIVGVVAAALVAVALTLYFTGVFPPRDPSPSASSPEPDSPVPAAPASPAPEPEAEMAEAAPEEVDPEEADPEEPAEAAADEAPTGEGDELADAKPADEPKPNGAKHPAPNKTAAAEPPPAENPAAEEAPAAAPPAEPAPPAEEAPAPKHQSSKCYKDAEDGSKVEVPCPW